MIAFVEMNMLHIYKIFLSELVQIIFLAQVRNIFKKYLLDFRY